MRNASLVGVMVGVVGCCLGLAACSDEDETPSQAETPDAGTAQDGGSKSDGAVSSNDAATSADARDARANADADADAGPTDTESPTVTIVTPREDLAIAERRFIVTGIATDNVGVTELSYVTGGKPAVVVPVAADGKFTFTFEPSPGKNTFEITVVDAVGNEAKSTRSAYFGHRISVGNSQSGMLADAKLFTWGRNELGQLGNGTLIGTWSGDDAGVLPAMYEQAAPNLVSIITRQTFMIALADDGTVRTWGSNGSGQLGYTTPIDCGSNGNSACGRTPAQVPGITDAVAVAASTTPWSFALTERCSRLERTMSDSSVLQGSRPPVLRRPFPASRT